MGLYMEDSGYNPLGFGFAGSSVFSLEFVIASFLVRRPLNFSTSQSPLRSPGESPPFTPPFWILLHALTNSQVVVKNHHVHTVHDG